MTNFEKDQIMCSGKNWWRKLEKEKVGKNRTRKEVNEHDANKIITQNDKDWWGSKQLEHTNLMLLNKCTGKKSTQSIS